MHFATRSKDAVELAKRAFGIIHIDEGVSCSQPIQGQVRQRQNGTITLMRSDPVTNGCCIRVLPRLKDEFRIDVQRMDMTVSSDSLGDFDCRVARTGPEIGYNVPRTNIGRLVKSR